MRISCAPSGRGQAESERMMQATMRNSMQSPASRPAFSRGSTTWRWLLILPIRFYRYFLSPWVGQACRFTPTCSAYAIEAIESHGPIHGSYLGFKRLCRCHPFSPGGIDPVPPATDAGGVRASRAASPASKPPL